MSNIKASSERIHLVNEMHDDLTHMEIVEIPEEFFHMIYISNLMLGTGRTTRRDERVHVLH